MQNIISMTFEVESEGYQAMTMIRQRSYTDSYTVLQAALVKRTSNDIVVCDSLDPGMETMDDAMVGGLLGSLVGIMGGPMGVLLMGSYGALAGGLIDAGTAADDSTLLERVTGKLQVGCFALVALVEESSEAALDQLLGQFKAEICRYDAAVIADEVEEAEMMQREMERQTRMQLRKSRREDRKKKIEEKRQKIEKDFAKLKESLSEG